MIQNSFQKGLGDGTPIGLGYFSVSFAFGISAAAAGVPVWGAALISMSNVTSAGQFAGLSLMAAGASLAEQALTQLVINLRYALMSLSLSQKLDPAIGLLERLLMAFLNTDEVFAVASSQKSRSRRWRFSTRASREEACPSAWMDRQGTSSSPASRAARRRRSPATSSHRPSRRRTVRGWSTPSSRMEADNSSRPDWSKVRLGWSGLG